MLLTSLLRRCYLVHSVTFFDSSLCFSLFHLSLFFESHLPSFLHLPYCCFSSILPSSILLPSLLTTHAMCICTKAVKLLFSSWSSVQFISYKVDYFYICELVFNIIFLHLPYFIVSHICSSIMFVVYLFQS